MHQTVNSDIILAQLKAVIAEENNEIANLSNASALLNEHLTNINWVGFYLWDKNDQQLILGPFQGRVACIRINPGKGVCGTAFIQNKSMIVSDVNKFPGHIFCDSRSESEIVIPLTKNDEIIGVLDIDAPIKNRFKKEDKIFLEKFVNILMKN